MDRKYYLGLDMGTSSVGWAVTDENYRLLRARGKDLWGVRLFKEAETAADRRTHRVSRRRLQREKQRIDFLRTVFSGEIAKIDPGFLQRLADSKYYPEDKTEFTKFTLFAGDGFTDREYYKAYPTIFHLRKELVESKQPHDVRLVYLAILNMFHHRGHFLNANLSDKGIGDLSQLYSQLCDNTEYFRYDIEMSQLEEILSTKGMSKTQKAERMIGILGVDKRSPAGEMIKLMAGLQGTIGKVFPVDEYDEEIAGLKFSFTDGNLDEKLASAETGLHTEDYELLLGIKQIHDWGLLAKLMKGESGTFEYLSQARVALYEKHQRDLKVLKHVYKNYTDEYNDMFRKMLPNNYSAYIGSVSYKGRIRRTEQCNEEIFFKNIVKNLEKVQDSKEKSYILTEIERGTFLPKQIVTSNGVIPNQVHKMELMKILENSQEYLPFLLEKDESGLTTAERIVQLFSFNIPYYVGPLYNDGKHTAWSVRRENGKVYPWNFQEKIDVKASAEKFISKMVKQCTYLNGENVLPKSSLLYERFMVLNELNNLRIDGDMVSADLKQDIYQSLFKKGKKVTEKQLHDFLIARGAISKDDPIELSGFDGRFVNTLTSYAFFASVWNTEILTYEQEQIAEKIIFWSTVYGESKDFLRSKIQEEYGERLSKEQLKRILGMKFKEWGKLSEQFLKLEGADKATGEIKTIIARMWDENCNLMELLSRDYTYVDTLNEKTANLSKNLWELKYEDLENMYFSAPVRRMVWQTILISKELYEVLGCAPTKIFIEMARDVNSAKERKQSRKKMLLDLYRGCKEDARDWEKEIQARDEREYRSKKLYLYYLQMGRCMYTGEPIDLQELFDDNLYDLDHIYPRHFIKDDRIENNLVLVKREKNARKSDSFPIEHEIQVKQHGFWKVLLEKKYITPEKYDRLTRVTEFTDEEMASFIARQIVETRQGTKAIAHLFEESFPESNIVYVKAGIVSDFRKKFDLIKCREVNDFHHANDAYLNIVVGNVYNVKFTNDPRNFIACYRKNPKENRYSMEKMFDYDTIRNGEHAWKTEKNVSITTVKEVMKKNSPLVTMMNYEEHGGLADQTIYSAKEAAKADGVGYLPVKSSDTRSHNVCRYGGFKKFTGAYFFLVEHTVKKNRVRTLEAVPLYLRDKLISDDALEKYCIDDLKLVNPSIRLRRIKMYSLISVDGFKLYLTGRSGNQLLVSNAVEMILDYQYSKYIKLLKKAKDETWSDKYYDDSKDITADRNMELYEVLVNKHVKEIFCKRPNSIGDRLESGLAQFAMLRVSEQAEILLQILQISQLTNIGADLVKIGGVKKTGVATLNKKITGRDEFVLMNQSPCGLFESRIDLLTV